MTKVAVLSERERERERERELSEPLCTLLLTCKMGEDQSFGGSSPVLSAYCHCPALDRVKNSKFKSECDCVLNILIERRERERIYAQI